MPKRKCKFTEALQEKFRFLKPSASEWEAFCTVCNVTFSVAHGGSADVTVHERTERHKRAQRAAVSQKSVSKYFQNKTFGKFNLIIS